MIITTIVLCILNFVGGFFSFFFAYFGFLNEAVIIIAAFIVNSGVSALVARSVLKERDENLWLLETKEQFDIDKVRYCPATELNPQPLPHTWPNGIGSSKLTWIWPYGVVESEYGSYGHNYWLYGDESGYFVSLAEWESSRWGSPNQSGSALIPIFVDSTWVDYFARDTDTCPVNFDLDDDNQYLMATGLLRILVNRHRDELNVGFIDGHAEPIELKMLWSLKWSKVFQTMGAQTRTDGSPIYQLFD